MKMTVSVADLKARLSEHLRRVKAGHEIIVTDRSVPVARLTPLEPAERRATRRDRLVRAGLLKPGRGKVRKSLSTLPEGTHRDLGVLQALIDERRKDR